MGKNLTQQKRGKGSPTYRANGFHAAGDSKILRKKSAKILDLIKSAFHSSPLAVVEYDDGTRSMFNAVEGMRVGDTLMIGEGAELKNGNALLLKDIPEGVGVCSLEAQPGDGGKYVKSGGATARVVSRTAAAVTVQFGNRKQRKFNPNCLAVIGTVAGGGRTEKPFLKAGNKFKAMKAKNKYWPIVSGAAMNAVDHPLGGKRSSRKGRPTIAPKNAPPGRKVGMIRPRSTGRARGTKK